LLYNASRRYSRVFPPRNTTAETESDA